MYEDVALICEADEQWSFVGRKNTCTGCGMPLTEKVNRLLHMYLVRADETCRRLLALLRPFGIRVMGTDEWGSYRREVPAEKHLVGKIFTQRIEWHNLNLRIHIKRLARKTICYSRSVELYEKVIGAYIEKHHYNPLEA